MSKREDIDRLNGFMNALAARVTDVEGVHKLYIEDFDDYKEATHERIVALEQDKPQPLMEEISAAKATLIEVFHISADGTAHITAGFDNIQKALQWAVSNSAWEVRVGGKGVYFLRGLADKPQPEPVAPAKPGRWKPGVGEEYWQVTAYGVLQWNQWRNTAEDRHRWARAEVYQTEAAAIYADKAKVALTAMRDWVDATGFVPDWEDINQMKQYIYYNHIKEGWQTSTAMSAQESTLYFTTTTDCQAFLTEFGPAEGREDRLCYLLDGGRV